MNEILAHIKKKNSQYLFKQLPIFICSTIIEIYSRDFRQVLYF